MESVSQVSAVHEIAHASEGEIDPIESGIVEKKITDWIEPLAGDTRLTTYPIGRRGLWSWYNQAQFSHWVVPEVDVSHDAAEFARLTPDEQRFIKHVLAFFAASDGIVNINIVERFRRDVPILEAQYFYDFQVAIENVHAEMYSLLLDTLIEDHDERSHLLNAAKEMPIITEMTEWIRKCIDSDEPFPLRLIRMACVEGIFFTWCFCAIYWLSTRSNDAKSTREIRMPGLAMSNELIGRDENLHTMFALTLFYMVQEKYRPANEDVIRIVDEAVNIAIKFARECLPKNMTMMNIDGAINYIQIQANNIVTLIDIPDIYETGPLQFKFMEQQLLDNRTNFFERRVADYSKKQGDNRESAYSSVDDF